MVTTTDRTQQILHEARQVQLSRVALTLLLGFFWLFGWLGGRLFLGLVIAGISIRRGWRDAIGYEPAPPGAQRPESIVR